MSEKINNTKIKSTISCANCQERLGVLSSNNEPDEESYFCNLTCHNDFGNKGKSFSDIVKSQYRDK